MPLFQFEAVERDGKIAVGTLSAADSEAVARQLQERGAVPLRIETGQAAAGGFAGSRKSLPAAKLSRFARELALLLDAGLRLDQALASVARSRDLKSMAPALTVVLEQVRAGIPFSEALEQRPELAPPYAIGMIRAGEAAGALATILRSLAELADRRARSAKAVRAALTYPAILAVTAAVSIGTLFTVVLPQLEPLFDGAGDRLPTMTVVVLEASRLFREYGLYALAALVAAAIAVRVSVNAPETRRALHGLLLRAPVAGGLIRRIEGGRFARLFSTLIGAGLPAANALELARGGATNMAFADALKDVRGALVEGRGIAEPLAATRIFPAVLLDLARVGEESGRLGEVLGHAANILEEEVESEIQRGIALLAPLLTIGLGGVIAFIIASVVMAILSMNSIAM
ncbi:type II secretion system F family protein [Skermanella mucosa]|uniref:type II secretion system F family protein n=1 Tax=Skermanella mucosa TaxID=1789672 RepID=UPI00192C3526|nr:type II secretion system F family protein [Skermanella mucosa]UEM23718.1 type II secretion system F family protein [Skermanella mucosa]